MSIRPTAICLGTPLYVGLYHQQVLASLLWPVWHCISLQISEMIGADHFAQATTLAMAKSHQGTRLQHLHLHLS